MDVTAIGELLIDFTTDRVSDDRYPVLKAHPGGAPCNFLASLANFGAKTALITKVGEDTFGHLLADTVKGCGIDCRNLCMDSSVFTTLAFVTLDKTGDRSFSFARKPGADTYICWEEIDKQLLQDTKFFHFGTLSLTHQPARQATQRAVEYAKANGSVITFDPNLRPPLWDSLEEAKLQMLYGLAQADVVKISENEVDFLFRCDAIQGANTILQDFHAQLVFVTMGAKGCYYATHNEYGMVPAFQVKTIDTTGAGDIFGGSALWKLLQLQKSLDQLTNEDLQEVTAFACAAAALSTTVYGGIPSVPALDDVNCLLAAQKR